jgi:hypothetical protein
MAAHPFASQLPSRFDPLFALAAAAGVEDLELCAWCAIEAGTPELSLSSLSLLEIDTIAQRAQALADRAWRSLETREKGMRIKQTQPHGWARCKGVRSAAWDAHAHYGLLTRIRGGRILPDPESEKNLVNTLPTAVGSRRTCKRMSQ